MKTVGPSSLQGLSTTFQSSLAIISNFLRLMPPQAIYLSLGILFKTHCIFAGVLEKS